MKKNILMRTNFLICIIIVAGFMLTAVLSYRANYSASAENIEQVSTLTSEGIYYQINSTFTKPVNISLTMANDSFLKDFLSEENIHTVEDGYIETLKKYLSTYQEKYQYDSVFLVSAESRRYYNFNGLDRVLTEDSLENKWYFDFLKSDAEYSMNVDNDEVSGAKNAVTVFVNCKIKNDSGTLIGVVGVGVRINYLQKMLKSYQDEFDVDAYLVDNQGLIQISPNHSGYRAINLFDVRNYGEQTENEIMNWQEVGTARDFWVGENIDHSKSFVVSRYLPELDWHLIVERDTGNLFQELNRQVIFTMLVIFGIILAILFIITYVIRSFNKQIVTLTQAVEQERRTLFVKATEQLYEKIYELDITNNRPANRVTEEYFESLGVPPGTPYDKALRITAEKQIKEEFRQGYVETFLPENILRAYESGQETVSYDFMILNENQQYYWMRITAQFVRWERDGSLHMLTYRQNIDAEKRQERKMRELAYTDEMTGLLTKTATERQIELMLEQNPKQLYAFFIFDIDHFKEANDIFGHAFGDSVIVSFTQTINNRFRKEDIIGRIGGDEFVAFVSVPDWESAESKAAELLRALNQVHCIEGKEWKATTSIGVAVMKRTSFNTFYKSADKALYASKKNGRDRYTMYLDLSENES